MDPKPVRWVYRELSADGTITTTIDLNEPGPERDLLLAEHPDLVRTLEAPPPRLDDEPDPQVAGPRIRVDPRAGTVEAW